MKSRLTKWLLGIFAVSSLTGCMVYEPRPHYYAYDEPGYVVYDEPAVIYVHSGGYYCHSGGYYGHRGGWR